MIDAPSSVSSSLSFARTSAASPHCKYDTINDCLMMVDLDTRLIMFIVYERFGSFSVQLDIGLIKYIS